MRTSISLLGAIALPFFSAININFDSIKLGELPPGWSSAALPGRNAPPEWAEPGPHPWMVLSDPNAPSRPNVLAHATKAASLGRSLCLFDKVTCVDGDVSVKFKIISGRDGQDAGIVFRAEDENNFYLVRASARDHNIAMFRCKDGRFDPVPVQGGPPAPVGVRHPIRVGDWNLMRVTYKGNQTTVYFNHRKAFEARDDSLNSAGHAGLWTKGDTAAYFDDFRIDKKK